MISDAVIKVLGAIIRVTLEGFGALCPSAPDWLFTGFNTAGQVWALLDTLSAWLPVSLAVTVLTAILAAYGVFLALNLARVVLSFLTLGGGAT